MTHIVLHLPIPISLNKAYNNTKTGRSKTADAKMWTRIALHHAQPYIRQYQKLCNQNQLTRMKFSTPKGVSLQKMKAANPNLAYGVTYTFHFQNDMIRDVFNFEKLLTDLLCDCGFLLDDNFIVDGRVLWGKLMPENPGVKVEIISLDRALVL